MPEAREAREVGPRVEARDSVPREAEALRAGSARAPRGASAPPSRAPRRSAPSRPLPELRATGAGARHLEEQGRTRDAAEIHEQQQVLRRGRPAVRGRRRPQVRAAELPAAKDDETRIARLMAHAAARGDRAQVLGEGRRLRAADGALVQTGDFETVARLYERARQFDQAALA